MYSTVYYSHFWYSRFLNFQLSNFGGDFFRSQFDIHRFYLRFLAIFFEHIYIPRTHLLTQVFDAQSDVPSQLFDSEEFRFLTEIDCLRVSTFPGLDDTEDSERIIQRSSLTDDVSYARQRNYLARVPVTAGFPIESSKESAANKMDFPSQGRWIEAHSKELHAQYLDIIARANLPDVPFFHESFARALKDQLPADQFEVLWRDTNSLYLVTGAPNQTKVVPYFNEELEAMAWRFRPDRVDRYLFNPAALYTFLLLYLTPEEMGVLINSPISQALTVLSKHDSIDMVRNFRHEYQNLVQRCSRLTMSTERARDLNLQTIRQTFEYVLDNNHKSLLDTAQGLVGDAAIATRGIDPGTSFVLGGASKGIMRAARNPVERFLRATRFPSINRFIQTLRGELKEISR